MSPTNRHPSTAWRPNLERCRERLSEWLGDEGAAWPELAAAVLVERGRSGMRVDEWAQELGVEPEVVRAAEAGALPLEAWPSRLSFAVRAREERWSIVAACALEVGADSTIDETKSPKEP